MEERHDQEHIQMLSIIFNANNVSCRSHQRDPRLGNTLALNFVCITFIMTVLLHSFATCKFVFISIFAGGFFYWFIEGFFSFFVVTKFFIVPMPTALIISVILWSIDRIPFSFSF